MNKNLKSLIASILLPLAIGTTAALFTNSAMQDYAVLNQPILAPPGWLFPVVWTILYILMGISAYLIKTSDSNPKDIADALTLYYYQLIVNFLWPIFFFDFQWYFFSFIWLLLLWVLIILMIRSFDRISKTAAYLNLPYLLWVTFATYLNFAVWWLNQ